MFYPFTWNKKTLHTCSSAFEACVVEMLVDKCVETLNVFDAMILAVSVTLLVNVAVISDINGVATVANGIGVDFDAVEVVGGPKKKAYLS